MPEQETFRSLRDMIASHPTLREPIIHGLLRRGETMNVVAAPKTNKTWCIHDMALSVASGLPWLGSFQTERCRVLLCDNELHPETLSARMPIVANARGIDVEAVGDNICIHSMRGRLQDLYHLDHIFTGKGPQFDLVIMDAFYRFLPENTDENNNGGMARLYNKIDTYAEQMQCAFVLVHHASKGNQTHKGVTDVGAGAGSQSRATDTHLVFRPHSQDDCVVLEAVARSWPPPKPVALRWEFPVWTADPTLDPLSLKELRIRSKAKIGDGKKLTPKEFAEQFVSDKPQSKEQILAYASDSISDRYASRLLIRAEAAGLICKKHVVGNRAALYVLT